MQFNASSWRGVLVTTLLGVAAIGHAATQTSDIELQRDVPFALHDGVSIKGDLYTPKAPGKYPALVALHGGGWQVGSSKEYQYWGPYLAKRGYVVFAINYRLSHDGIKMYPEAVHDTRAAVQFLRSRGEALKIDSNRMGLIGDSAGGHLCSLVALAGDKPPFVGAYPDDPYSHVTTRVNVCVSVYGAYDMAIGWNLALRTRPLDNPAEKFLGVSLIENRQIYFEASPISYATRDKNMPPVVVPGDSRKACSGSGAESATCSQPSFLLAWGTEDETVEMGTDAFLLALQQAGFFTRTVILTGAPHFWMGDPIEEPGSFTGFLAPRLLRFLEARL